MKKILLTATLLCSLAQADVAYKGTSIGLEAGIYGLGANVKAKFTDNIGLKAGFATYSVNDFEVEDDNAHYNFDLKLQDFLLVADYHPFKGSFKLSGGMIVNNSELDGTITPSDSLGDEIQFDFTEYTFKVSELGAIKTKADFDPVAPYIGIGWDTSFDKKKGFGFTFDIGVAYQGSVKVDYSLQYGEDLDIAEATKDIPDGPLKDAKIAEIEAKQQEIKDQLQADLDTEMASLQEELDKYEWMPYIAIGFNYKF